MDWKRYGPEERMWKPVENLENAKESIDVFYYHYLNYLLVSDLRNYKLRRSLAYRRKGTVMNISPDNPDKN